MIQPRQNHIRLLLALLCSILVPTWSWASVTSDHAVVLHLKNGDQISGCIVSENSRHVVISNTWVKALSIPVSVISSREPSKKMAKTSARGRRVAKRRKPSARHARVTAASKPSRKAPTKSKGIWHGQINIGTSVILNSRQQQDYSGRAKFVYLRPYHGNPKKFFRNTIRFGGEYQRTDGQESANRAHISNKTDFDLWDSFYAYAQAGVGYDRIQNIDFQDQFGPGVGLHLIQRPHFALDTELGATYQNQYNHYAPNLETFYARLAEDFTWEIWKNLELTEHVSFYPDFEHRGQYHTDCAATLSYGFWKYLTLNLTVEDKYNTQLSAGTDPNEFDFRTSLGCKF